jgi:hypothetical protein
MERIEAVPLEFAPHSPDSPDLAPPDFFVFANIEQTIAGDGFGSPEELEDRISNECSMIPKVIFQNAFVQWQLRLQACVEHESSYFSQKQMMDDSVFSYLQQGFRCSLGFGTSDRTAHKKPRRIRFREKLFSRPWSQICALLLVSRCQLIASKTRFCPATFARFSDPFTSLGRSSALLCRRAKSSGIPKALELARGSRTRLNRWSLLYF